MVKKEKKMRLSDQALGAVMMALQKSLLEESDIVPTLKGLNFTTVGESQDELLVTNPPLVKVDTDGHMILNDGEEE
tara:strand:+ start:1381 stop:1608 length:228 start_codon:yes stop_codon:yes gene_type:complete